MTNKELHPLATPWTVLLEQIRVLGLALKPVGMGVGLVLLVVGAYGLYDNFHEPNSVVGLPSDLLTYLALVGLVFPMFLGRGSATPFQAEIPWTLPVGRSSHVLIRTVGGWFWLMVAMAVLLLWAVGLPFLSGGELVGPRLTLVGPYADPSPADPAALPTVLWSIPWWLWLVPFPAATVCYLFSSALLVATPKPGRWIGIGILTVFFLIWLTEWADLTWLADLTEDTVYPTFGGRFGISSLFTGATATGSQLYPPTGETLHMFSGLPTFGRWVMSSAIWIAAGSAAVGLAALRHRDGRGKASARG